MIPKVEDYRPIVGAKVIDKLKKSSEHLQGKHVVHVNSTSTGGGVAEILNTLVFLMNDLGIRTGWRVIFGSHSFFKITKGFHNSLQGDDWHITGHRKRLYNRCCKRNSIITHIKDHDIVVIHDPQPLGMIRDYELKTTWLWRCHIDISKPNKKTMEFLLPFIRQYDGIVVSSKKFKLGRIKKPHFIINPSIDPLSTKNREMDPGQARRLLAKHGINAKRPIIAQVSRFDRWKNPTDVLRMYQKIRDRCDCQLVLMGDMAADDPEGPTIYYKVRKIAAETEGVTLITEKNDLLVNALQKESRFMFQNSIREGFGLTVSEAMWKGTPVLGTDVGGIPLQIKNARTGYIIKNMHDGVKKACKLIANPKLRDKMGRQAREHVRKNFLITRHLQDYIDMFSRFYPPPNLKGL